MANRWLQIRGDPSIRRFLFSQSRVDNEFDDHLETVTATVEKLLLAHGIFHAKIHFSSGQVTLWSLRDPYNYQVYLKEDFLVPGFLTQFECIDYPQAATVPASEVHRVLEIFCELRRKDATVYLRSGSLNVINGMVGLNFSCDGSHYVDYREFADFREFI